jgi:hypothetical protein
MRGCDNMCHKVMRSQCEEDCDEVTHAHVVTGFVTTSSVYAHRRRVRVRSNRRKPRSLTR